MVAPAASLNAKRKDSVFSLPTTSVEYESVTAEDDAWNWVAKILLRDTNRGRAAADVHALAARLNKSKESALLANFIIMLLLKCCFIAWMERRQPGEVEMSRKFLPHGCHGRVGGFEIGRCQKDLACFETDN